MPDRATSHSRSSFDPWLRVVVVAVVVGLAAYSAWQRQPNLGPVERPTPSITEEPPRTAPAEPNHKADGPVIASQTIRDQDGRVIFRGDVDVSPTLERIKRGDRLSFSHDGIVFQNRERRLPQKPAGYYHEFVHPTPRISGPGPQRIIVGREGETYYTPDHYRTFKRLDE
jgi:guanyl-specific ribonuclease Sa